jgi:hypothetical protein
LIDLLFKNNTTPTQATGETFKTHFKSIIQILISNLISNHLKFHPCTTHSHFPERKSPKSYTKDQSINTKCNLNCEKCKPKSIICKQQTTSKIENKIKVGALQLAPHFMITNHLLPWHFLLVQMYAMIHPLSYFFI